MNPQELGAAAETRVLNLLISKGWQLLDRNWTCQWGEIDLVMHKKGQLLVVEVKGRSSRDRDRGGWTLLALANVAKWLAPSVAGVPIIPSARIKCCKWFSPSSPSVGP